MINQLFLFSILLLDIGICPYLFSQPDSVKRLSSTRLSFPQYDEEISYGGPQKEYLTIRRMAKDGHILRSDSYQLLPEKSTDGQLLDSLSRVVRQGTTQLMYPTGQTYIDCQYKNNELDGPFLVYYPNGVLKRRDYYQQGSQKKSQCYTLTGQSQRCKPLYQLARFRGKPNQLKAFFEQNFASVIDGQKVRLIALTLLIDEAGEVIRTKVDIEGSSSDNSQVGDLTSYAQHTIEHMPKWAADKANWQPALNDGSPTASSCVVSMFRHYGSLFRIKGSLQCEINYQLLP